MAREKLLSISEQQQELTNKRKFLRARFKSTVRPDWFAKRLLADPACMAAGVAPADVEAMCNPSSGDERFVIPMKRLDALEDFLRRFAAGGVTAVVGEEVEDPRSPLGGMEPRNAKLTERFTRLRASKPHGFVGEFLGRWGFAPTFSHSLKEGACSEGAMDRFEKALDAEERGLVPPAPGASVVSASSNGGSRWAVARARIVAELAAMKDERARLEKELAGAKTEGARQVADLRKRLVAERRAKVKELRELKVAIRSCEKISV